MIAAFVLASVAGIAGKANKITDQYNYKDQDNHDACTFFSNTDPCSGGTNVCNVTVNGHQNVTIYKATSLVCSSIDNSKN